MRHEAVSRQDLGLDNLLVVLLAPAAVTVLLWLTSANPVSWIQGSCAFFLLVVPWSSYLEWRVEKREAAPLFAGISFLYWLYFGLALFWGNRDTPGWQMAGSILSDEAITRTMVMVAAGVLFLWLGLRSGIANYFVTSKAPDIPQDPRQWNYLRFILLAGVALSLRESASYMLGAGWRQPITIIQTTVPMAAFVLLFRNYLRGKATESDRILIGAFLGLRLVGGLSSGWTGSMLLVGLTGMVVYIGERKRVPAAFIVAVVAYVLFFQAGKDDFRKAYWYSEASANKLERITFWVGRSFEVWSEALQDPTGERVRELALRTLMRTSLLTQAAHVLEMTPSEVPYQNGRLYSYMAITWIPRFAWPDKPSANEANRFYQVAYGITISPDLDHVSIAVGSMTEAYINFGWVGVPVIMFLEGVFLDFFRKFFLARSSGLLWWAIGIALTPDLFVIEEQAALYFGGLGQRIFFTFLVFLPMVRLKSPTRHREPDRVTIRPQPWLPAAVPEVHESR